MTVDARLTQAYYSQVPNSQPTDNTKPSYRFPCGFHMPDLVLLFKYRTTTGYTTMLGRQLSLNNLDPKSGNGKFTLLSYRIGHTHNTKNQMKCVQVRSILQGSV